MHKPKNNKASHLVAPNSMSSLAFPKICLRIGLRLVGRHGHLRFVGEMNLSKSGEFGMTSFLSLWLMRSKI